LPKRFAKQVTESVLNDIASDAALKYIDDNKLDILGQPIPADSNEMDLDKEEYEFTYELGFAPELNMVFDQTVTLPFYNIEVTEQMIDDQDKDLRNRAGEQVPAQEYAERALVKGSIMQLDENGNVKENGIQVNDGILAPFLFKSKEEAAKFEGTKVGDKVVFDAFATCDGNEAEIASMLHIDRDKIEEARGNFEINIAEFVVHTPAELGQEFYDKVFGADTIHNEEEYRKRLSEIIAQGLQPNSRQLFTRNAEDYLMETYGAPMQLPMAFLRKFMLRTNTELKEDAVDEALNQSVPGIKWEIIENKAAELLNVKVTEDDVKAFARMVAIDQLNQYGMGHMADQMADYFAENLLKDKEQHRRIVRQTFNGNLMSAIHNAVKLDEKTVSLDEFRTIVAALNNASGAEVAAEEAPEA
ncbi:MAG: trigger factor family protein, partial [Muribaculaceae bacterium]|nr:trigger factor family protein [Muribaculaceae bacterium]